MLSFEEIYQEVQEQVQDTSATSLVLIKRAINQGAKKFGNMLNRDWRTTRRTFSLVADQQYYQMPEDCIRVKTLRVDTGNTVYSLTEIADEDTWNELNMTTDSSSTPDYYFIEGNDLIGIYPIPAANITDGATLKYERSMRDMEQDDYEEGTISVTNGSTSVEGSGTTFTEKMVGRTLFVTDGTADGMGYKVSSFVDSTHLTLENKYGGSTGSAKSYRIAEVPDIPEEYHESLIDYGCFRYYLRRKNRGLAKDFASVFSQALESCQTNYSSKTTSQYVRRPRIRIGYNHIKRDQRIT